MKQFLLFLWQLPQNILGLLLIAFYKPERKHVMDNGNEIHYASRMLGGISLGKYSLVNVGYYRKDINDSLSFNTIKHEAIGHAKQSLYLGWLYLIVIGLPSILHAWLCPCKKHSYYDFFCERWADEIAGIKR